MKYNEILSDVEEVDRTSTSLRDKYINLKKILDRYCKELTQTEVLQFPSLFSRLVFIAQKYNLPQSLEWQLQNVRVKSSFLLKDENNVISEFQYNTAKENVIRCFSAIYNNEKQKGRSLIVENRDLSNIPDKWRVQVIAIDTDRELLICQSEFPLYQKISVRYNVPKVNDAFNKTIDNLWIGAQLNLIDSKVENKTGFIIPRFIVLEPDYLIDASALAECFQNYGKSHLHYFRKKFETSANSRHILLGNLANFFLDELIYADDPQSVQFEDTFLKAFKQSPFEYTSCGEIKQRTDFVDFMDKAKSQFKNILRVVLHDFPQNNIDTKKCTLEPSFYCEKFGFQGRLDLLELSDDTSKIVELKSGGLPFPKNDPSKIAINHETQTAIYRLIIQSVFNKQARNIYSTILYSASSERGENIRLSASYQTLDKEIINIRNLIVSTEHDLYMNNSGSVENIFDKLFDLSSYGNPPQFFTDRIVDIQTVVENATNIEKKYFYRFISFLSRELYLHKTGDESVYSNIGVSSLWATEFKERQESYDLISDLEILQIDDSDNDMKIRFKRLVTSNFVNFRDGEICILYPHDNNEDTALTNQILKGTIAEIKHDEILVRFRYKQKNKYFLTHHRRWVLEHDRLDHTYTSMFKGLYSFLKASVDKRRLILGLDKPRSGIFNSSEVSQLTQKEKQERVIEKAMAADDYFLIVGPPGTGKTSIFVRRLIELFYTRPECNILVMAYTNRAVDELCEAINQAFGFNDGGCMNYIRIGSELSCSNNYKHRLLQNISRDVKSRNELRTIMFNQRIYVGTLASITGRPELFDLKDFNVAIIDEASQILEPQLIGLLPKFEKFIMIGDHKQLSTITLQDSIKSKVDDEDLNNIELTDCRESYFERIFRICQKNNWNHAYETLTYQGRMHHEVADFPNRLFYDNNLLAASDWQSETLLRSVVDKGNIYHKIISENRLAFISTKGNHAIVNDKINENEATLATEFAKAIIEVYEHNKLCFDSKKTLGIITPYRNQIALIKHKLEITGIPQLQDIMIDTVERYQGSQRDVIILSFCMNKPYQLKFFSNLNREGSVDRKLNVALTRARQQLFLIGNETVLRQNRIYNELIDHTKIFDI